MFWTQEAELPQVSVAVQVRLMAKGHLLSIIWSDELTLTEPQLSVAVALPASPKVQSNTLSEGQVTTGLVASLIVIVCTQEAELSHLSLAVQVRLIITGHLLEMISSL